MLKEYKKDLLGDHLIYQGYQTCKFTSKLATRYNININIVLIPNS